MDKPIKITDPTQARYEALGFTIEVSAEGIWAVCQHNYRHPIPETGRLLSKGDDHRWTLHRCDGCCTIFKK